MRPSHLGGAAALATLALAGIVYTQVAPIANSPMLQPEPHAEKGPAGNFAVFRSEVEGAKTLQVILGGERSAPSEPLIITSDDEIDVTSIHMHNGTISSRSLRTGGFEISSPDSPGGGPFWFFVQPDYGSRTINLDPPLKLRAGDTIRYLEGNDPESRGYLDIVLHGRDPSGQNGIILR